jgi:2-polyprenyl-3-methyl-5-hydroxy-6-metoxy-1,4-benzoquinol methylase
MNQGLKEHWNKIYTTNPPGTYSWNEEIPSTSLDFIRGFNLPRNASIIDIGGGDSKLVDCLLGDGYNNITVLDISAESITRAKLRLGEKSKSVQWVESDILQFNTDKKFDLWHDRAVFHFLTNVEQVNSYLEIVNKLAAGFLVIGTFSSTGPEKCSGLPVKRYDVESLERTFSNSFKKIRCINADHITPLNIPQNFSFCSFKRMQ